MELYFDNNLNHIKEAEISKISKGGSSKDESDSKNDQDSLKEDEEYSV
jgi:hypothetical protein